MTNATLSLTAGQPSELLVTMPLLPYGKSYAPCFTITVTDARGDSAMQTLCTQENFPLFGDVTMPSNDSAAGAAATDTQPPSHSPHTSTACSIGRALGADGERQDATIFVLATLGALWVKRRRR